MRRPNPIKDEAEYDRRFQQVRQCDRELAYENCGKNPEKRIRLILPEGSMWTEVEKVPTDSSCTTREVTRYKTEAIGCLAEAWLNLEMAEDSLVRFVDYLIDVEASMILAHCSVEGMESDPVKEQWESVAKRIHEFVEALVPLEIRKDTDEPTEPDSE